MAIFTIDLEDYYHAVLPVKDWPKGRTDIYQTCFFITDLLKKYKVKAIVYATGHLMDKEPALKVHFESEGHIMKTHGYWHKKGEKSDRQPYAWLGLTGGFYFRALPYNFIRDQVIKHKHFYIHPHDIYENHPRLSNPLLDWKRHVGLKTARKKLEKLLQEVEWDEPN